MIEQEALLVHIGKRSKVRRRMYGLPDCEHGRTEDSVLLRPID